MDFSEINMIMLVYGGLFLYTLQLVSSKNKILVLVKLAILIILFGFISTTIWLTYNAEEYHINNHSGYEPISFTHHAILMIVGLSIYSVVLFSFSIIVKRNWYYKKFTKS